jgi:hypothetical protein
VVDILEAEQEAPSGVAGEIAGPEGGEGVPEVQQSGGAGSKTGRHRDENAVWGGEGNKEFPKKWGPQGSFREEVGPEESVLQGLYT